MASSFRGFGPPPKGYIPGVGRGAAGFTTRSDIGNMANEGPSGITGEDNEGAMAGSAGSASTTTTTVSGGTGSRAAELRAAKLQQAKAAAAAAAGPNKGYMAGAGRGSGGFEGGTASSKKVSFAPGISDETSPVGGGGGVGVPGQFDDSTNNNNDEDDEADLIWQAIDDRMEAKRRRRTNNKRKRTEGSSAEESSTGADAGETARARIGAQFRELKEQLATVSEEDWMKIPDVGDHSLKFKKSNKHRDDVYTPLTDTLLEQRRSQQQPSATSTEPQVGDDDAGQSTSLIGLSGLGAARGTVLGMSLDKMSDSVTGQTVVDPQGYLTSLSNTQIATNAQVGDINKARLLLKSVRDTNPKHGPGWIASARVEEAAGKIMRARKLIQEGCEVCADQEDVWLEAARLHPPEVAKSILATAVRRIPTSVRLFLKAADLEVHDTAKKAVLRKALEANPTSITLWKAAIDLEEAEDAKVLLSVAVERVPHSVDLWLALARLETYDNARKVLNKARRALPAERSIWIAAAKLEEGQHHEDLVNKIMDRAFQSLSKNDAVVTRSQWLQEAEQAEASGAPLTSAAIVKHSIGMGVDDEDRQRTWADDAKGALVRGSVATARAILAHALQAFPSKRSLWMQAVELERQYGTADSLDDVLKAASERLPRVEIFWLLRAKERWLHKDVDVAREILTQAFAANPDSESVWLAAAKLEWETGETERARVLLQRARERAPTERVYMKSALLEREYQNFEQALELIDEGIEKYPKFPKLYMIGGQIYSQDMKPKIKSNLEKARRLYQRGLTECPNNVVLWTLASRLEEEAHTFVVETSASATTSRDNGENNVDKNNTNAKSTAATAGVGVTKARSLLELARLKNPKNPELWLESIRLERRAGNTKLAETLMARALQECPSSGLLLAENIVTAPRVEQKSKSTVAIKRCPESPLVIAAVASLFASERKVEKARKWLERAVVLDPDIGDSWARYYAFELEHGTKEQQAAIKERCVRAEPKHGEVWQSIMKDMSNRHKTIAEGLDLASKEIQQRAVSQPR